MTPVKIADLLLPHRIFLTLSSLFSHFSSPDRSPHSLLQTWKFTQIS